MIDLSDLDRDISDLSDLDRDLSYLDRDLSYLDRDLSDLSVRRAFYIMIYLIYLSGVCYIIQLFCPCSAAEVVKCSEVRYTLGRKYIRTNPSEPT